MTVPLRIVLDASVCVKQFINDPFTQKVNELFDHLNNPGTQFFVPDLFYIECSNVLWKYARANLYTSDEVQANLADLKALRLEVTSTKDLMLEAVQTSLICGITAYDACYVALSQRVDVPLLTLDEKLVSAIAGSELNVQSFAEFVVPSYSG